MVSFFFRFILGLFCFFPVVSNAQFVSATLGINGLTCSMCSFAVQSELERLPFVEQATLNLNTNVAEVLFKTDQKVNIREVVDAVYKAGFSVGYTEAVFIFDQQTVSDQFIFSYEGFNYQFLKPAQEVLNGKTTLKFLDKKFLRKKAYTFWAPFIKNSSQGKTKADLETLYHVTL
jgi:copper chaperone CopZ